MKQKKFLVPLDATDEQLGELYDLMIAEQKRQKKEEAEKKTGSTTNKVNKQAKVKRKKRGESKMEKLKTVKLSNGIEVLAVAGGKHVGEPRSWGGTNGRSNAERNAKALGAGWKVYQGDGSEFYVATTDKFREGGAVNTIDGKQPQLVLFMGPVGVGKTTTRRQQYAEGYVHIDASEIFAQLTGGKYCDFPGEFQEELELLGSAIAKKAVNEKRNIVMEIIGDSPDMLESITNGIRSIGYGMKTQVLMCDEEEGQKRHKNACETDVNYVSAYYTQSFHQKWLLAAIEDFKKRK